MVLRSLFSGVSGLRAFQTAIDVIGNNIANVNTIGFKSGRATFQDLFNQTMQGASGASGGRGGTNPLQIGLGVQVASVDNNFSQGSLQTTGRLMDLAVQGNGFFQLTDGAGGNFFTRAGNFSMDEEGYMTNPGNGYRLMGFPADASGNVDSTAAPSAVQVDFGRQVPATVTTEAALGGNLSTGSTPRAASSLTTLSGLFDGDGKALHLRAGEVIEFLGGSFNGTNNLVNVPILTVTETTTLLDLAEAMESVLRTVGTSTTLEVNVNDDGSLAIIAGASDAISDMTVDTSAGGNTELTAIFDDGLLNAGIDVSAGSSVNTQIMRQADSTTSIDVYDSQGNPRTLTIAFARDIDSAAPLNTWNWQAIVPHDYSLLPTNDQGTLVFNSDGTLDTPTTKPILIFDPDGTYLANGGVNALTVTLDFSALSQTAGANTASLEAQNGNTVGELDSVTIDADGILRGIYTNGETLELAQILLANIPNEGGLHKVGGTLFIESANTGEPVLGVANTRGRGSIASGTLEISNVDLSQEFTNLIIAQRGFQANSRIITTGDEILQEVVNLVR
jgi:flagellar hook protein FlgE